MTYTYNFVIDFKIEKTLFRLTKELRKINEKKEKEKE